MNADLAEIEMAPVIGAMSHRLVGAVITQRLGIFDCGPVQDGGVALVHDDLRGERDSLAWWRGWQVWGGPNRLPIEAITHRGYRKISGQWAIDRKAFSVLNADASEDGTLWFTQRLVS